MVISQGSIEDDFHSDKENYGKKLRTEKFDSRHYPPKLHTPNCRRTDPTISVSRFTLTKMYEHIFESNAEDARDGVRPPVMFSLAALG